MARRPGNLKIDNPAWPLLQALISYWGVTDALGGAGGVTLLCGDLVNQPDFDGNQVVIISGPYGGQARDINGITTGGVVTPHLAFGGQIVAGTIFAILALRLTPAEVAALTALVVALMADVGDTTDAAVFIADNVSSVISYLKGLLGAKVEAYGTADAGSDADTLVDAALTQGDDYWNGMTLLMITGANAGLTRPIVDFTDVGDTMELRPAFPAAIVADDVYVILSNYHEIVPAADSAENYQPRDVLGNKTDTALQAPTAADSLMRYIKGLLTALGDPTGHTLATFTAKWGDIAISLDTLLGARWDGGGDLGTDIAAIIAALGGFAGVTGIFHEQVDAAVNITAIVASETDVFHLTAANTRYIVRSLRLKCADPSTNTVTVRLYELVNDGLTNVDSFDIDATNFGTYHSLMDMFGLPHLAGDELQVTVQASAGGPYVVTGQYSHGKTNV